MASLKKIVKLFFKFALVALLLIFLAKKGFISLERTKVALEQTQYVVPAFTILLFSSLLGVIRWHWLLTAQGIALKWTRTLQLTLIGNFFNIALPGAVSGDFVKAFYVANEVKGQRAKAFGSILFDRVAGLSALVLVAAGAFALDFGSLLGTPLMRAIQFLLSAAAVCVLVFYGYLFTVQERHDPALALLTRLEAKTPKLNSVTRIYQSLRHYHDHRWTVVRVVLLSILVQLCVGSACVLFAKALGETSMPLIPFFIVVPLGLLVTAVPILPGGIGTGNAALGALFLLLGSQRGADVYSLLAISQFGIGGIGGLVYLRFKSHEPALELSPKATS